MMQVHAVRIHTNGGPEVLGYEAVECARLQENQVRIRQTAIGVNFIDIHHRSGRYPSQGFPLVLGMEGAGSIEDVVPPYTTSRSAIASPTSPTPRVPIFRSAP